MLVSRPRTFFALGHALRTAEHGCYDDAVPSQSRAQRGARKQSAIERARSVIAELFNEPPSTDVEIPARLEGVDPKLARLVLVERLRGGEPSDPETELFMALFGHLGVAEQRSTMADIVLDSKQSHRVRAYACGLLATEDPVLAEQLMDRLPLQDRMAIIDVPFIDMLVWAQADMRASEQLADALDALDLEAQVMTFERLESHRKRVGTGAVSAYGPSLRRHKAPGLHRLMLDSLVEESAPEGLELVRALRDAEREPTVRRTWQGALLRMGTRAIDPTARKEALRGRAYISSCDHHGDFVLLGCIDNPDGSVSVANVCIRVDAELRAGFVLLRQTQDDVAEIMSDLESTGGGLAPLALGDAAAMIEDAALRTAARRKKIPRDAEPAMGLLRRAASNPSKHKPEIAPAWDTSPPRVRTLIERPEHARIWILTDADREVLDILPPPSNGMDDAWIREAAGWWAKRSKRRNRLVAMARHMALWHRARKEHDEAALCASLARMTEKRVATSPLVIAMLERAFLGSNPEVLAFTDPARRDRIRKSRLASVTVPKGKDLARLDFTEAAFVTLTAALQEIDPLPVDDAQRLAIAGDIADAFVDGRIGRKHPDAIDKLRQRVSDLVQSIPSLPASAADKVASYVLTTLESFQSTVCSRCEVRCVDHARAHFPKDFFSDAHPALDTISVPF